MVTRGAMIFVDSGFFGLRGFIIKVASLELRDLW